MEEGEVGGGEKFAPPSLLTSRTRGLGESGIKG